MEIDNYNFRWTSMPSSRKADYYLAYYDDSVFIDFNNFNSEQVVIVRISFDGFGCCNIPDKNVKPMSKEDSKIFKLMFKNNNINQNELKNIIIRTLTMNKHEIWEDALNEYHLI
ncbi:MAG: hypothetical protein JXB17_04790 [Bacteroidales bacterium]|nr:hypothetical protein [Bacteroidales bacterium]